MDDRLLRWTLALHPRAWRERYGKELLDLSEELLASHETTRPRLVLGLLASAVGERARAVPRTRRLVISASFVALIAVVGAVLLVLGTLAPAPSAHSAPTLTVGGVPPSSNGKIDLKTVPDFVTVTRGGRLVGYTPRAYLFPSAATAVNSPVPPKLGAVAPVYARDLTTLVGHMYPGVGFVPLGASPAAKPCRAEYTISSGDGTTTTSTVACPMTLEVVPDLVGMFSPTAMGELSGQSLQGEIMYVHSATTPAGHVVAQSPPPGTKVHARTQVQIVSSVSPGTSVPGG